MRTDEELEVIAERICEEGFRDWARNAAMAGAITAGALAGGHVYADGKPMYDAPKNFGSDIVLHQRNYDTASKCVRAKGRGATEKEAIDNAIRSALEGSRGSMVDTTTVVQNDDLVNDEISSETFGTVEKYKVLDVDFDDDDQLYIADVQVWLGNDTESELGQGEVRGGRYYGRTRVDNDELTHDQFGLTK